MSSRNRRVYLAAPYGQRAEMAELARHLTDVYHIEITSRWVWNGEETPDTPAAYWATVDLQDIDSAEIMIIFPAGDTKGSGRHVEFGYALARNLRIIAIGERPNAGIFYHHPAVEWYPDLPAFYAEFGEST